MSIDGQTTDRPDDAATPGVPAGTLGDRAFERMLGLIYGGELPMGSVIKESALSQQFGMSRGPVREAIRRLQGIQLVTREPYLKARVVSLQPAAVLELFQVREALEGYACRLAAERMGSEEIESIEAELMRSREAALRGIAPGDDGTGLADFHGRIVQASRNQRIIDTLCGDLYHLLRLYRLRSGSVPDRRPEAFQEHWQILRAIRARDGELAESLMRSHITRAARLLLSHLPADTPGRAQTASHPGKAARS